MTQREISRSKIGPFSLTCTDSYIGIGREYESIEGYSVNNNCARFDAHIYHSYRETNFNDMVYVKLWQSHWGVKCRLKAPDHGAGFKGVLKTINIQGLTLAAIISVEKKT